MIDVIMLSNTANESIRGMTQNAVSTLKATAPVKNLVVVETNTKSAPYEGALSLCPNEKFNYNRFVNFGYEFLKLNSPSADFVMIANNDLHFHPNWWEEMKKAFDKSDIASASPLNPGWQFHQNVLSDMEIGFGIGRNFCGWCLIFRRETYEKLHPLDEQFEFWCQDNDLACTMSKMEMKHALVRDSKVTHLTSQSHGLLDSATHRHFTDGMAERFHKKWC